MPLFPNLASSLPQPLKQVTWHGKGDYFATVVSDNSHLQVLIHQASKRWSQAPFRRSKGQVQRVLFHPLRPYFFVATQRFVRIYHLLKQELTKKLLTNCKWVSSMAAHPGGEPGAAQAHGGSPSWPWAGGLLRSGRRSPPPIHLPGHGGWQGRPFSLCPNGSPSSQATT